MLTNDTLFNLLPAIYRIRDAEAAARDPQTRGIGPLQSLLRVLSQPLSALADNLEQLHDDAFIETCDDWVVPYIGDLIGARSLPGGPRVARSTRAEIAHTIGLRRRKGTTAVLETLARDVTNWDSRVVEFFQLVSTTQYMNHARPRHRVTPSTRAWQALEHIGTGFDSIPRTIDVRSIRAARGRYHVPNVGVFVWPVGAHQFRRSTAARVDDRRFRIHPLGYDTPLYTLPGAINGRTTPINAPLPLSRRVVSEQLPHYYGPHNRSLNLRVDGADIDIADVVIANLGDLNGTWAHLPPAGKYAIDPVLGRVALPPGAAAGTEVELNFAVAFGANLGGGEYERADTFAITDRAATLLRVPEDHPTIQDAVDAMAGSGIVQLSRSARVEGAIAVHVPDQSHIELRAASGARPVLVLPAAMAVSGGVDSQLTINGFLIAGAGITVDNAASNTLRRLTIRHCTLVPGLTLTADGAPATAGSASLEVANDDVRIELDRVICGALRIDPGSECMITDSIIDACDAAAVACAAPGGGSCGPLTLEGTTVIGRVMTRLLTLASNTIFTSVVTVADRQQGCVRFSHVPAGSRVPRKHRCQPESSPVVVQFVSPRFGTAWYAQLDARSAESIRRGADDDGEMGAYHHVQARQREANLRARLDEYLRVGLEAGIFRER